MSVGVAIILIGNTWRILRGQANKTDLIQVVESEDSPAETPEHESVGTTDRNPADRG